MRGSILITDTQSDFGKNLAEIFSREGYEVFTPRDFDKITKLDILADLTDFRETPDDFEKSFRENAIAPMAMIEKCLPLLDAGSVKRLFYVTSAEASINETRDAHGYAYKMTKAALHQFLQMVRNRLAPEGYTLRLFDPMRGKIDARIAAESAFLYITRRRGTENHDPNRDDENDLIMRDAEGRVHGW